MRSVAPNSVLRAGLDSLYPPAATPRRTINAMAAATFGRALHFRRRSLRGICERT
ncbi:hypothetical protein C8R44DRAFT_792066 [Mycena epipterygia]|nr:hypothetical protein C8R44DRAFT_792066 [Mycena epipterygia]